MRRALRLFVAILLVFFLMPSRIPAVQETGKDVKAIYNQAVVALNSGKIHEAKAILDKLLANHPDIYRAHELFWDAEGRTADAEARKAAIRRSLGQFEKVPFAERTEEFYQAAVAGCEALQDSARAEAWKQEAISKFPRGGMAQSARLDSARKEKDPVKAAAMLQSFADEFDENVSWTWIAVRERFNIILKEPDLFNAGALAASAESYEQHTKRFIETFGNPYKYVDALRHIARALQDRDPAASLSYAQKALAFIQETWATTDEFDDRIRVVFWPSMIRAYGIQKNWAAARKIGDVLVREIDSGSLEPSVLAGLGEDEIRRDYALALEQTDAIEQAREQLAWAVSLNKKFKAEFDSFDARHPLKTAEAARFKALVSARRADVLGKQELQVKKALLATETRKPAAGFKLQNLDGKSVSLADFRGRTLILAFWATWCAPCKGELEEFGIAFKKHKSNPKISFAAVSIDTDKALVAPFAKKNAYQFPILLSDGKIEEPYQTQSIPKLYVIDGAGRIRFLLNGYIEDGYFLKKLNWMIAAASK